MRILLWACGGVSAGRVWEASLKTWPSSAHRKVESLTKKASISISPEKSLGAASAENVYENEAYKFGDE
jgi:hypothetical protein